MFVTFLILLSNNCSAHGEVYSIQLYVIKFVRDLRKVKDFLRVPRFASPIKLTSTNRAIVEHGVGREKKGGGGVNTRVCEHLWSFIVVCHHTNQNIMVYALRWGRLEHKLHRMCRG
jgi:hypothetical protein